jgi:hypothetical protein
MHAQRRFWFVSLVLIGALGLVIASRVSAIQEAHEGEPAYVEPVEGSALSRVILSEKAAERLAIATTPVADEEISGELRKIIPYAAVIYTPDGETWTYTSPEPLVFVREAIDVERIDGDKVILTAGPETGTEVVTLGAAELFGAEAGVGH